MAETCMDEFSDTRHRAEVQAAYESWGREAWALLYAHCCDADLAREALQEAFLRLYQQPPGLVREALPWVVRVGRNWLYDRLRQYRRCADVQPQWEDIPDTMPDPATLLQAEETRARVRGALATLMVEDREVLVLRYALNWSSERMARTLETTVSAVDMRLSRARRRLARVLQAMEVTYEIV